MLNTPLFRWIALAAVLAALAGVYNIGHIDGTAKEHRAAQAVQIAAQTAHVASLKRAIAQAAEIAAQDAAVLSADVVRQARVNTQFEIIGREVNRYALTHRDSVDCLDSGGMRVWIAASRGDAATLAGAASGDADDVSEDLAGAGDSRRPGPAEQLHPGGEALSPAAGAVSEPERVGADVASRPAATPRPVRVLKPDGSEQTKPHWGW